MKNAYQYRALVLAVLPFLITGVLLLLQETLSGVGYLIALILAIPVLAAMSGLSLFLAFSDKDRTLKLIGTTKVLSLISMAVFGAVCVAALY